MSSLFTMENVVEWCPSMSPEEQKKAIQALESGKVLYCPHLAFALNKQETELLSPQIVDPKSKNISYSLQTDRLGGSCLQDTSHLKALMKRYAISSRHLLDALFPDYKNHLMQARTSFRPTEIKGRKSSYRKNDTLLHVDAFPATPTAGKRILRVFANINHEGKPRIWHTGETFEQVMQKFIPQISAPIPGLSHLLKFLKITKSYRTLYDHYMLKMHNQMKGDPRYQKSAIAEQISFPPGSAWIVYTDQVSHAALSGQHVLEQTFYISVASLNNSSTAPLKRLEKFLDKKLA